IAAWFAVLALVLGLRSWLERRAPGAVESRSGRFLRAMLAPLGVAALLLLTDLPLLFAWAARARDAGDATLRFQAATVLPAWWISAAVTSGALGATLIWAAREDATLADVVEAFRGL